jgi:pimeloyl-ACP methyl ester carboxylesterase
MASDIPVGHPRFSHVMVAERRIRYVDIGSGQPLLLVHGLGASWRAWEQNIPDLATDHRVIAVDLPGFGGSEPLRGPVEIRDFADALAGLLDHLDVARVVVVGHSLGGLISKALSVHHPSRVDGLVLVGSGTMMSDRTAARLRRVATADRLLRRLRPPAVIARPMVNAALAVPVLRHKLAAMVIKDPSIFSREMAGRFFAELYLAPGISDGIRAGLAAAARPHELLRISCPTLVLCGDSDRLVSVAMAETIAILIPGAELEIWKDVGHHPMWERPDAFNARLRDFSVAIRRRRSHCPR